MKKLEKNSRKIQIKFQERVLLIIVVGGTAIKSISLLYKSNKNIENYI